MKKILKTLSILVLGFSLAACGSSSQKAFEEKFNTALTQLTKADSIHVTVGAKTDDTTEVGMQMDFKAKNLQTQMEAQGSTSIVMGTAKQKINELYIVDNAVYIYDAQSGDKIKSPMNEMANMMMNPTGMESKAVIAVMDVKGSEKGSDGSETFTLKINQKAVANLLKLAGEFSDAELSMVEEQLEVYKDTEFYITFGEDGNFKQISLNIMIEGMDMKAHIDVNQINGNIDVEIPMLDEYVEQQITNY